MARGAAGLGAEAREVAGTAVEGRVAAESVAASGAATVVRGDRVAMMAVPATAEALVVVVTLEVAREAERVGGQVVALVEAAKVVAVMEGVARAGVMGAEGLAVAETVEEEMAAVGLAAAGLAAVEMEAVVRVEAVTAVEWVEEKVVVRVAVAMAVEATAAAAQVPCLEDRAEG